MSRWWIVIVLSLVVAVACVPPPEPEGQPPRPRASAGFRLTPAASGLEIPTNVEWTPDGRLLVAERSGIVKVFDGLADAEPTVAIDLSSQVHSYGDFGLLGLAVGPTFPAPAEVFVYYVTDLDQRWNDDCLAGSGVAVGCRADARVAKFTLGTDGRAIGSEQVLVDGGWCHVFTHGGGDIAVLPDGTLAVSAGEGANWSGVDFGQHRASPVVPANPCGDPPFPIGTALEPGTSEGGALRAQDLLTPGDPVGYNGAIIRIDPNTGAAAADNALARSGSADDDRIIAHGFRNPFRLTTRPGTGELWVGDVGWATVEEVDRIVDPTGPVGNFGWPCFEADIRPTPYRQLGNNLCSGLYDGSIASNLVFPYFSYPHDHPPDEQRCGGDGGASMSGVGFYTGTDYPERLHGAFVTSDYVRGCVWALHRGADGLPDPADVETLVSGHAIVDIESGPAGDLLLLDIAKGEVLRLEFTSGSAPPNAHIELNRDNGPAPLQLVLDATGSDDPEGGGLEYAWDMDADGHFDDSSLPVVDWGFRQAGDQVVSVRVTDGDGVSAETSAIVHVGNTRPTIELAAPSTWSTGAQVPFVAAPTDAEDGDLNAANVTWELVLEHCASETDCHEHPIDSLTGSTVSVTAPNHEHPAFLVARAKVVDSAGLEGRAELRIPAATREVHLTSTPPGVEISLGERTVTTPVMVHVVAGSSLSLIAPTSATIDGVDRPFRSWSDDGDRVHDVTFPDDVHLHANYGAP